MRKRQYEILDYIFEHNSASLEELTELFGISKRTLYYDLKEINGEITPSAEVRNLKRKFQLVGDLNEIGLLLQKEVYYEDRSARLNYILYQILQGTFGTIQSVMEELQVSKTTVVNDIQAVRRELKAQGLTLSYDAEYDITGNERKIREMFLRLMTDDKKLIDERNPLVEEFNRRSRLGLTEYSVAHLSKIVDFVKRRINNGHLIRKVFRGEDASGFSYVALVRGLFGITDPKEIQYLTLYIATLPNQKSDPAVEQIQNFVRDLVDRFEALSAVEIEDRRQFETNIARHIRSSFYRIKYRYPAVNPVLRDIKTKYSNLFRLVKRVVEQSEDEDFCKMREEEIGFLAMYFGGNIRSRVQPRNRVVIVCPNGLLVSKTLEIQLYRFIPTIQVMGIVPLHQLKNFDKPYDYIVSTIPIPDYDNVIVAKPILTKANITALTEKLVNIIPLYEEDLVNQVLSLVEENCTIKNRKRLEHELLELFLNHEKKKGKNPMLKELLTRDRMFRVKSVPDWKTAIAMAAQPLLDRGEITERYVEKMVENVLEHGPYIVLEDGFALAHASGGEGVNRLAMSLMYVEETFDLEGRPVNVVIVLASPDNEVHLDALASLSEHVLQDEGLDILMTGDLDRINQLIQST